MKYVEWFVEVLGNWSWLEKQMNEVMRCHGLLENFGTYRGGVNKPGQRKRGTGSVIFSVPLVPMVHKRSSDTTAIRPSIPN